MAEGGCLDIPTLDPIDVYKFGARARYDESFRQRLLSDPRSLVREVFGVDLSEGIAMKEVPALTSEQVSMLRAVNQAFQTRSDLLIALPEELGTQNLGSFIGSFIQTFITLETFIGVFTTEAAAAETTVGFAVEVGVYILLALVVCIGFACVGPREMQKR